MVMLMDPAGITTKPQIMMLKIQEPKGGLSPLGFFLAHQAIVTRTADANSPLILTLKIASDFISGKASMA